VGPHFLVFFYLGPTTPPTAMAYVFITVGQCMTSLRRRFCVF
jgi:hypothetical protein